MNKTFLHVDLDAFFASVEQRDNPQYRGKPLIVGGLPGDRRAVVSTASYEARKYGVHSAMPVFQAIKLCPNGIFIRGNYQHYGDVSDQIMEIFSHYSPTVIQMSIDEAMIDITGTEKLFGPPEEVAKKIKKEVYDCTALTVSVGLAPNMYLAKIASGLNKPDGLTIIPPEEEETFMLKLPLDKLWGVGSKTQEHLKSCGLTTIQSIYEKNETVLRTIFGEGTGTYLYNAVRGNKDLVFGTEAKKQSLSSEQTFEYDLHDIYAIETSIMELCNHVLYRMHKRHVRSKTIALKIRYEDFKTVSIQQTYETHISNADDFFERSIKLFHKKYDQGKGIRLLGITADNLEDKNVPVQQELFEDLNTKKAKLEEAIFKMEDKNPSLKVKKARLLNQ